MINNYLKKTDGKFALILAIMAVPLALMVGYSLDLQQMGAERTRIKGALDSAALAAVMPSNLSDGQRIQYAKDVFDQNFNGKTNVKVKVTVDPGIVTISGETGVESLFAGIVGQKSFPIFEESQAEITQEQVVCVLALDPSSEKSIEFKDNAIFEAPSCSVQSNSTHNDAIFSSVLTPPKAEQFCATGGSSGAFADVIKHGCTPVEDPYADLNLPTEPSFDPNNCLDTIQADRSLSPGVYCNGLKIDGARVLFQPGIYHIWGELLFTSTSEAIGHDVTFILKGPDARLKIDNDAKVTLSAPSSGETSGIVFWQKYLDKDRFYGGLTNPEPDGAEGMSEISASGGLSIIGTAYFPSHELVISSDRRVATLSPATSFIAYRLQFAGESLTRIQVDHEAGGVPPLLPRSDAGARLVY